MIMDVWKDPPPVTHKLACYQIAWVWTYCSFSSSLSLSHCFTSGSIHGGVYDLDQPPPFYVTCSFLNLNWEMIYSTHLLRCVNINHQSFCRQFHFTNVYLFIWAHISPCHGHTLTHPDVQYIKHCYSNCCK